jgi:hypothetical protein
MKWGLFAITAVCLSVSSERAAADDYDTRRAVCGESSGFRQSKGTGLFGCFPFCCIDDSHDACDCDTPCCEYCGKKRRPTKRKPSFLSCLGCEEVPRGRVGMAIAARVNGLGESADEQDEQNDKGSPAESTADEDAGGGQDRISRLESDMTRLTFVVEELARSQQQQQKDLTRATILLEKLAE